MFNRVIWTFILQPEHLYSICRPSTFPCWFLHFTMETRSCITASSRRASMEVFLMVRVQDKELYYSGQEWAHSQKSSSFTVATSSTTRSVWTSLTKTFFRTWWAVHNMDHNIRSLLDHWSMKRFGIAKTWTIHSCSQWHHSCMNLYQLFGNSDDDKIMCLVDSLSVYM